MKQKSLFRPLVGGALLLLLTVPALSQPPGPPRDGRGLRDGGPGFGGPGGPRRGPRAKGELMRVWHDIAELEGSKNALSKTQSAKVVALVLPVTKKATLSDADAKTLAGKVEAVLTSAQKTAFEKDRPRSDRPRGARGERPPGDRPPGDGGGRGPGGRGPGGPEGPRPSREDFEKVRPFMDALNPFYAPTGYASFKSLPADFQQDVIKRYKERRALLETLSRRAKAK